MPEPPLVVEDLSFRYRSRQETALQRVSFSAERGEILLIAGASGCGKTTLIRCINGLIPHSYKGELSGRIRLHGQETLGWPLSRISQIVGTVLQDPERQILGTRVLHEVAFGLENLGLPRSEILERVEEALGLLHIQSLRDRETFQLSGGEKQKVALAGVLAMRPSILLLDEPLASLDPASALETLSIVRRLADDGMTVLLVEHRVEDVLRIHPERVLFMDAGEVKYLGSLEGLGAAADYRQVKLPASVVIQRAKESPPEPMLKILPGVSARAPASGSEKEPEKPAEALVKFEDVTFGYNGRAVLRSVNLEIRRGDVIALLGPNGAGKTTLVKHAIGLLKPQTGRVLVGGQDTRQMSVAQIAGTLGYVFQSPSHMLFAPTVLEELSFGPKNLGHPKDQMEKEVKDALQIVNLSALEKEPPLALSFGQQKRVSIAAILAMQSRILAMDEPTAGQDYWNYMNFMDSILQIPHFEAILFITHDVDLAVIYANRVLLMANGEVVADGSPHEVLSDAERLETCHLVPTSLLAENLKYWPQTRRFLRAEALAHL